MLSSVLLAQYGLKLIPDLTSVPVYAGCNVDEIIAQMTRQMSLGDAVLAVQLAKYAPAALSLVTWNAKHFHGKVLIPVLTPDEWLLQQASTPSTP